MIQFLKVIKSKTILAVCLSAAVAALYLLGTIGCDTPRLSVRAKEIDGRIIFDFTVRKFYLVSGFVEENRYSLYDFEVCRIDKDRHRTDLFWKLKVRPNGYVHLKSIEYGKVPEGYQEVQGAKALKDDCIYEMTDGRTDGFIFLKESGGIRMLPRHGYLPYLVPQKCNETDKR